MSRRAELAELLPQIVTEQSPPTHLIDIYSEIEQRRPDLVDDEVEPGPGHVLRWRHELRWELETLVVRGQIKRRKDLGRAIYSG